MNTIFQHGVASGDPLSDAVVIWTRASCLGDGPVPLSWTVADLAGAVIAQGACVAEADRDWTVSVDVTGLQPSTSYQYWFETLGDSSPLGRTKTLPAGDCNRLRFAQVSCAKYNAGYFNAYRRVSERSDLDFVLHLGDYIYEASQTPPASQTASKDIGRPFDPLHECRTLADYRTRYAQYRSDPDVQALHATHPVIATVDDHEFADGAWREGATEHREDRDGPWRDRLEAAFRAREEWLPVRRPDPADPTRVFRAIPLGGLAELFLVDTRTRRDQPCPPPGLADPNRSALGVDQREWLFESLKGSQARWRLLGNPSVMAQTWNDSLSSELRNALVKVKLMDLDARGCDWDQWDGYPVERAALLDHVGRNEIRNVVVVSGDVHIGMAIEISRTPEDKPVAVEFVNSSLTSQNLDDKMGWDPRRQSLPLAEEYVEHMRYLKWVDFDSHGYSVIEVTPEYVKSDWWAVDGVLERSAGESLVASWMVLDGEPRLLPAEIATSVTA